MNSIIRLEHVAESCSGCHDRSHERRPTRRRPGGLSSRAAAGGPGAVEAGDVEVHVAQPAAVDPDVAGLAARRAGPHPGHGGEAVLRVQLTAHGPRQPRAPRVHGEPARRAPVEEGAGGDVLAADVAVRPRLAVVAAAAAAVVGAGECEVVPRVHEEGAQDLRVRGALLVQVEAAAPPVAAVASAGDLLPAHRCVA